MGMSKYKLKKKWDHGHVQVKNKNVWAWVEGQMRDVTCWSGREGSQSPGRHLWKGSLNTLVLYKGRQPLVDCNLQHKAQHRDQEWNVTS